MNMPPQQITNNTDVELKEKTVLQEEPPVEQPPTEQTPIEEPTAEQPTEQKPIEEPSAEQPTEQKPIEEPAAEQPTEQKPIEEPTAEQPTEPPAESPAEPPLTETEIINLRTKEKNVRSMILNKKSQCEITPHIEDTASQPYIDKIQIKNELTTTEEMIANILKEYPKIHPYLIFQLPIRTTPISLATIDKRSIEKCSEQDIPELFTPEDTKEELIQTTYKKIGDSLFDYLRTQIKNPRKLLQVLVDSQLQLLDSISKLQSIPIIHFHLTEENILYDEINAIPVISDFRMAFTKEQLDQNTEELFPSYDESPIWCIDIYIVSQLIENNTDEIFTQEVMDVLLQQFISTYLFKGIFNEAQMSEFSTRMKQFFGKFINRLKSEVITELTKHALSWDTFSVCSLYLLFIKEIFPQSESSAPPSFLEKYTTILTNNILSDPDKRPSISFLKETIENLFTNIPHQELKDWIDGWIESDI